MAAEMLEINARTSARLYIFKAGHHAIVPRKLQISFSLHCSAKNKLNLQTGLVKKHRFLIPYKAGIASN
jgi:hypothetical protein